MLSKSHVMSSVPVVRPAYLYTRRRVGVELSLVSSGFTVLVMRTTRANIEGLTIDLAILEVGMENRIPCCLYTALVGNVNS